MDLDFCLGLEQLWITQLTSEQIGIKVFFMHEWGETFVGGNCKQLARRMALLCLAMYTQFICDIAFATTWTRA